MASQLNYAICMVKVGDKTLFLDATEKYLPIGVLPERCLNGLGLVISKTNHGWVDIEPKVKAKTVISSELKLDGDGEITAKVSMTCDGYDAHRLRDTYYKKGEADYVKGFLADKNWEIAKSEFQNIKEINSAPQQIHEFTVDEYATLAGNVVYLNPFVTGQTKENVFKLPTREYPVDFGSPIEKVYMSRITLPEGFTVDELPKPKIITLPGNAGKFSYNVTIMGNTLNVVSMLQINKSLFLQDEYPLLREFYNQMIAKQAEQIVLKKL